MKIYLAAMYDMMMKMRAVAHTLAQRGHIITAQWIDGKEANDTQEAAAVMDYEDVKRADTLVAFSRPRGSLNTGGGRHVEFGIALALQKQIIVIGPRGEHVFHAWPDVQFYVDLEDAIARGAL